MSATVLLVYIPLDTRKTSTESGQGCIEDAPLIYLNNKKKKKRKEKQTLERTSLRALLIDALVATLTDQPKHGRQALRFMNSLNNSSDVVSGIVMLT